MMDCKKITEECISWVYNWFENNGKKCNCIIGESGGKDSLIVSKICSEALGKERIIGVAMPDYGQGVNNANKIAEYLGISYILAPIGPSCDGIRNISLALNGTPVNGIWTEQTEQNIPPRIRMAMLYAIAQTYDGRVAYCDNASERYIGYFTKWGDGVGDFGPIANLTVTEVLAIGDYLGLPYEWVHKKPSDGLPHSQDDEDKIGFSYKTLDEYIRNGICDDKKTLDKILAMHTKNTFKVQAINIPSYDPHLPIH